MCISNEVLPYFFARSPFRSFRNGRVTLGTFDYFNTSPDSTFCRGCGHQPNLPSFAPPLQMISSLVLGNASLMLNCHPIWTMQSCFGSHDFKRGNSDTNSSSDMDALCSEFTCFFMAMCICSENSLVLSF